MQCRAVLSTFFALLAASAHGAPTLSYKRANEDGAKAAREGRMTVLTLDGQKYVPLQQLCGALGCKALYQWAKHRVVIENPRPRHAALVSHLTPIWIRDGQVQRYEGRVLVTADQGYLLPQSLALSLARDMGLGILTEENGEPSPDDAVEAPAKELSTVIIDPGHGGFDLGTAEGTLYEKDIALFYAKGLKDALITQMPDLKVILTREEDRFVSLGERTRLANQKEAALFVSLHINHADDPSAMGVETYILSPDATDSEARKTQLLENESWIRNAKVGDLPTDDGVKRIFVDLEQQHFIKHSAVFAAYAQQELGRIDGGKAVRNRGVKQAFFYVLSQAAMPAVLVEMGFLSNDGDRARIMNAAYREQFIKALVTAVIRYKGRPPARG